MCEGDQDGGVLTANKQHTRRELVVGPKATTPAEVSPEQQNNTEVVAQVGGTATIKCYTHFWGDEVVRIELLLLLLVNHGLKILDFNNDWKFK